MPEPELLQQNQSDKQKGSMPKMPEFGIPCIVPRLVQAGGDGEEKQSQQITVRNRILIKTSDPPWPGLSPSPPLQDCSVYILP